VRTVLRVARPARSIQFFSIPLLHTEKVSSADFELEKGKLKVSLPAGQSALSWESTLDASSELKLLSSTQGNVAEVWKLQTSNLWHVEAKGVPEILEGAGNDGQRVWRPRPGEELLLHVQKPKAVPGPTLTVQSANVLYELGPTLADVTLECALTSSLGQAYEIEVKGNPDIQSLERDGVPFTSYTFENGKLRFDLTPGSQRMKIRWREKIQAHFPFTPKGIHLAAPSANLVTQIRPAPDRWILFTGGPRMGPAVLIWGLIPMFVLIAFGIAQSTLTPFRFFTAFVFLLGLSMQPLSMGVVIFGFFIAVGLRGKRLLSGSIGNLMQIALAVWAFLAVSQLFAAIRGGLLGSPNMRIAGNGSNSYFLIWSQDVSAGVMPSVAVYSVPLFAFRICMLLWAIWLAFSIIRWGSWVWTQYSYGGVWASEKAAGTTSTPKTGKEE
jgi:hypothetical protein